jgi:hypothetical protein
MAVVVSELSHRGGDITMAGDECQQRPNVPSIMVMVGNGVIKATKDYVYQVYSTGIIYVDGEDAKMTMKSGNIYAVREYPPG